MFKSKSSRDRVTLSGSTLDFQSFIAAALALAPAGDTPAAAAAASATGPSTTTSSATSAPEAPFTCPQGMKPIWGSHLEQLQRICVDWRNPQCWAWFGGAYAGEGRTTPVAACMDEHEWPNERGEEPLVMVRFTEAKSACEGVGKRLCSEFEWETACEGPEVFAYPYGNRHEAHACNNDKRYRSYSGKALEHKDAAVRAKEVRRLYQGEPSGSRSRCVSGFGVVDLIGNAEEWVTTSRPEWPHPSSLKGGYWSKPWSGCRGTNDSHGPLFRFYETGFRCCADPVVAPHPAAAP